MSFHSLDALLGHHCNHRVRWVRVCNNPGNILQLISKIPAGFSIRESLMILLLLAHRFNPITSRLLGNVSEIVQHNHISLLIAGRYQCHVFTDFIRMKWSAVFKICLSIIVFTDFVLASLLCYLLATSRTGFSRYAGVRLLCAFSILNVNYTALIPS
jgi:hypothetical protein